MEPIRKIGADLPIERENDLFSWCIVTSSPEQARCDFRLSGMGGIVAIRADSLACSRNGTSGIHGLTRRRLRLDRGRRLICANSM
ncbi:MAG: hypothetical protein P0Y59_11745 [Candidatus Sphingomonas phytovorans]|nr:hypothetical protein [Sphingomonas sp.]WEK02320.1 MAG: hypothetical protein P0Y59_11745 [Sphingomonas sp.]